jgi:signal transduction histidine kinase
MIWNWLRRHPFLVDVVLALAVGTVYVGRAVHFHRAAGGVTLALLQVAPLLVRRRYPVAVLAVVAAACALDIAVYSNGVPVAAAIAAYTVAEQRSRTESLVVAAIAALGIALTALVVDGWSQALGDLVPFAAAWVFGDNLGTRRAYTRALEERAERLEREQEREAARAVAEEQARIARELHDVIAHNLSVMVVQAAAANDVFDARPERAREALRTIEATGRTALAELRRLLGGVRGDGADFTPQPDLGQLDVLIDQVRAAGLQVVFRIQGEPRPLPAALELSAYRVVQEALTNTLKHAHASRVDIALNYSDGALDIEVCDDGTGNGSEPGAGHGLIGMRERVGVFGGSLDTGPAPGGGFKITARFPSVAGA